MEKIIIHPLYGISMWPTMKDGQEIGVDRNFPFEELERGDVIMFFFPENQELIVHRCLRKRTFRKRKHWIFGPVLSEKVFWETKGDNNKNSDRRYREKQDYLGLVKFVGTRRVPRKFTHKHTQ